MCFAPNGWHERGEIVSLYLTNGHAVTTIGINFGAVELPFLGSSLSGPMTSGVGDLRGASHARVQMRHTEGDIRGQSAAQDARQGHGKCVAGRQPVAGDARQPLHCSQSTCPSFRVKCLMPVCHHAMAPATGNLHAFLPAQTGQFGRASLPADDLPGIDPRG